MAQEDRRYTLDQVLAAERAAWAESGGLTFRYDGINIWVSSGSGEHIVGQGGAPQRGWRHRANCTCPLCRSE
jgi:hypothetical protein